ARNDSTSTREIPGTSSLSSSSLLTAISGTISDIPVMFSEGLERLSTSPVPRGSPRATITMGMSRVAFFKRCAAGVVVTAITSGLRLKHSSNQHGKPIAVIICGKVADLDVACVHVSEVLKTLEESIKSRRSRPQGTRIERKKAESRNPLLLRPCRDRPRGRRAAEQRNEVAPSDHSITWSARASSDGGTSRPSSFAVLRLIASSYLVGACTGRSAGFSPFRMRPAYRPIRWYAPAMLGP